MNWKRLGKRVLHWLLAAEAVILLITGLGITKYEIVETITFGLLTKNLSHKIHNADGLWISFLVLLALHIFLSVRRKKN